MKRVVNWVCLLLAAVLVFSAPVRAGAAFEDVPEGSWFAEAVEYVCEKGLMNGVGGGQFAPAAELNRAMAVTVLYRLAGEPEPSGAHGFADVPEGCYYDAAVSWAQEQGIVNGVSADRFAPARSISRQEMVTFFYRYALSQGLDTTARADLSEYADCARIAPFAEDAFSWAVAVGLVEGSGGLLMPEGSANRAQFAVIVYRFCRMHDDGLVLRLVVVDGVATDLVSGRTFPEIHVSGEYMCGGVVTLPKHYTNWTYEMIVDYNEDSSRGIINRIAFVSNSGKYEECTDVFMLRELTSISNRGGVCIPWVRDSWYSGYVIQLPVQLYTHLSADYEYLPTGDSFWSFSMDSGNGLLLARINGAEGSMEMKTWVDDGGETRYVDKIFPASFTLNSDHAVRELRFYDRPKTAQEQQQAYEATGITAPESGISRVTDGLTDLGSSYYLTRTTGGAVTMLHTETTAGSHTLSDGNGRTVSYTISDFVQPDNGIDNSGYESVHITNAPETLELGKQYPLTALPYPFRIIGEDGKADEFDVSWSTSDSSVLNVIDGLLIAKAPGTVQITATLMGTDISDTVTITVTEPPEKAERVWNIPADYVSPEGDRFSDTDYAMTTRAIYAAIDQAAAEGYNHVVFPQQDFYAEPITDKWGYAARYYVPSGMTIEFPEGSVFHMMDNEVSRGSPYEIEIHYFEFGVPTNDYTGVCEDSHLIVDTYYGERWNTERAEREFLEENRFVNFGRKAVNCSVEIRNAYSPAGYFLVADGVSVTNRTSGVMNYGDFVSGWLDDGGTLQESENWISTECFISVPDYGTDGYFLSADGQDSYAGKYWGGCSARLYDILWYDASQELISIDRFRGRGEYYDIPEGAVWCKVSLQQGSLPAPGEGETADSPWLALHDDGAAKFCEIKNTRVYDSACGLYAVMGQCDGLWVHDCFTNRNGMRPRCERTAAVENGWTAMRHSVVSHCCLNGYFGNPGGFNTFIHTNFLTNYSGFTGEAELLRYINNTTDHVDISEKAQAHVYYNTVLTVAVDRFNTSIGHIYTAYNDTGKWVRAY